MNKEKKEYDSGDTGTSTRSDAETTELYTQSYDANKSGSANVGSTGEQVADKAGQIVDQAKDALGGTVDQVREQAVSQVDQQKSRAAETLNTVAGAVRQTGDQLRQQDQGTVAQYVDTAANQIERMATYLNNRDINDMAVELQHFARRQPALFLGGALLAGMLAARFLKSSSQQVSGTQGRADYGYGSGYRNYSGSGANRSYSAASGGYGTYTDFDDGHLDYANDYPGDYGSGVGSVRPARVETSGYTTGGDGASEGYSDSSYGDTGLSTDANSGPSTEVP